MRPLATSTVVTSFVLAFRSNNFIVGLTDVSPAILAPTLWNYDVCAQYPGEVASGATVNLTCTSCMPPRRYLVVQIPVTERLSFCEVEVYIRSKFFLFGVANYCIGISAYRPLSALKRRKSPIFISSCERRIVYAK